MSQGRDFLLFVSPSGVTTTGLLEVPLQGDLRMTTGKSTTTTAYKNGQSASQTDAGFSLSLEIGNTAPMATAETRLWSLHDSGDLAYFEVQNSVTGGLEFSFLGRVAIPDISAPTSGPATVTVNITADGQVTRSAAA